MGTIVLNRPPACTNSSQGAVRSGFCGSYSQRSADRQPLSTSGRGDTRASGNGSARREQTLDEPPCGPLGAPPPNASNSRRTTTKRGDEAERSERPCRHNRAMDDGTTLRLSAESHWRSLNKRGSVLLQETSLSLRTPKGYCNPIHPDHRKKLWALCKYFF
jgi:hypothetical protein